MAFAHCLWGGGPSLIESKQLKQTLSCPLSSPEEGSIEYQKILISAARQPSSTKERVYNNKLLVTRYNLRASLVSASRPPKDMIFLKNV